MKNKPRALIQDQGVLDRHSFREKWQLDDFQKLLNDIYDELLPEDYRTFGVYTANSVHKYSTIGLDDLLLLTEDLGMKEETQKLLQVMLAFDKSSGLTRHGFLTGQDDVRLNAGLLLLTRFFYDPNESFNSNKLWEAIEVLKLAETKTHRDKIRTLFIDLADELMSNSFQQQLRGKIKETGGAANIYKETYQRIIGHTLGALSQSGDLIAIEPIDSVKVTLWTQSSDPALREAIRRIIAFAQKNRFDLSGWPVAEALQISGDIDLLRKLALKEDQKEAPNGRVYSSESIEYSLAAGDLQLAITKLKAVLPKTANGSIYIGGFASDNQLRITLKGNTLTKYLDLLKNEYSSKEIEFFERKLSDFQKTLVAGTRRPNSMDWLAIEYHWANKAGNRRTEQQLLDLAKANESAGDSLNAAFNYVRAAFVRDDH
jgi:hypothetical protein